MKTRNKTKQELIAEVLSQEVVIDELTANLKQAREIEVNASQTARDYIGQVATLEELVSEYAEGDTVLDMVKDLVKKHRALQAVVLRLGGYET
jgi:hypothetical protein